MNLKSKIAEYFKTYWKNNVLLKSIAIVVTVCFLINISNLPAFAKDNDDELLKKRIKKQETNSGVLYQGDQTYGSVSYMQFLQDNTKVDDNDVISVKDKNGRFEAKGYWDPQTQQAMTVGGDGKYTYNETYTKVVKKIKGIEDETAQQQHASTQPPQEAAQAKTQTDAAAAAKSEVKNEQQKDEVVKTEQKISSTESDIKKTEQADRQSEEKAKLKAAVESANAVVSDTQKATTPNKPEGDDTIDNKPNIKTVQNIGNQDEKYDEVLNNLMRETGLSKEEIELEFAKLTDEQRENVISALYNLYRNNQSIVYCAADALGNVLNQIGSGALAVLAFGLIIADAVAGLFTENNKGLISGASSQLYISAKALQTVLAKYGKDYNGYTATIDDIVNGLGLGESVIVHVGGNHFITVSKNEDGTFTLSDINRPDKKVNLGSGEELNALLSVYFQGNNSTTVLAKSNGIFTDNKMLSDLSKIIGATTDYNDLLKNPAEAAAFYLEHGDKSYNELMKLMFGSNATLTHEQSIAFAQFYKVFLDQSIKGLSQKVSENKAGDIQSDIDKLN
ncbi:MAG: hypothetical protein LBH33_04370, partial [Endomicrobium sp.]|nr:hypothetical protein [Endomicrobium sp.]